jgi:putative nucleotidyltransferase with HDIG domain
MKNYIKKIDNYIFNLKKSNTLNNYLVIIFFIITFLSLIPTKYFTSNYSYKLGDIAKTDIKSPKNIIVYDYEATREKIKQIKNSLPPVFDFHTDYLENKKELLENFFDNCSKHIDKTDNNSKFFIHQLETICKCKISEKDFQLLKKKKFSEDIQLALIKLISYYMEKGIVPDNTTIYAFSNRGVTIRLLPENEEITKKDIFTFNKLSDVKKLLRKNYIAITGSFTKPYKLRKFLIYLASHIIEPNIFYNKIETETRLNEVENKIKPIYYRLKKNEIIVREGSKIDKEALTKLNAIKSEKNITNIIKKIIAIFIILLILCYIFTQFSRADLDRFIINARDILFVCCVIAFFAIFFRISTGISLFFSNNFNNISPEFFLYMIPYGLPVILISTLVNEKYAYFMSFIFAIFFYIISGSIMSIYVLLGSLFLAGRIKCCYERFAYIKLGLELGFFNIVTILGLTFFTFKSNALGLITFFNIFAGFINGLLTSFLVLGFIPIVEVIFRYTSDLRLIELSNLENELMREFMEKAPGSYQHSILVGRLAESAAKAIGANSLLARVGAYYHDIGKMKKPLYFIENQSSKENKHNKLTPNMSALILISHVKEGVELAIENKLGDEIIDIIEQHHGTSLIKYFYKKALELHDGKSKENIDEKNFRYPGPKPKTKEAGIVMLADIIEATSRTLHEPTPARIKGLVKNLIENVLNDGQLNECYLTLRELTTIRRVFTNTLNTIFHQRIDYPKDDKHN